MTGPAGSAEDYEDDYGGGYDPATYNPHPKVPGAKPPPPPPPLPIPIARLAAAAGQDAWDEAQDNGATKPECQAAYSRAYNKAHPMIRQRQNHQRQNKRAHRKYEIDQAELARQREAAEAKARIIEQVGYDPSIPPGRPEPPPPGTTDITLPTR